MKKFMFLHFGFEKPTPEIMEAWMAWFESIADKQVDPVWSVPNSAWAGELGGSTVAGGSLANPLKARWMGIYNGAGIHGTADEGSLGSAASHGCIRMSVLDVVDLYDRVPTGSPIYIA